MGRDFADVIANGADFVRAKSLFFLFSE